MSVGQKKAGYFCLLAQNQQTTTNLPVPPDLTAVSVLEMTHFVFMLVLLLWVIHFHLIVFSLLLQMVVSTLYKKQESLHKRRFETTEKNH